MRSTTCALLFWSALLSAGQGLAADACIPTAAVLATALTAAPNKLKAERDAQQADRLCRTVAIEPKAGGSPSMIRTLQMVFTPKSKGSDRLKPAAPMGMPTGPVMPRAGRIEFDASEIASEQLVALDIDGPQVRVRARPMPPSGVFELPSSTLMPGAEYRWLLTTGRQKYEGTFTLPDADTLQRTKARLDALAAAGAARGAALLLEAAIYDDEELFASRDLVIVTYRRENLK